jgi:hypothetical protein
MAKLNTGSYPSVAAWTSTGHSSLDCMLAPAASATNYIQNTLWKAWIALPEEERRVHTEVVKVHSQNTWP